MNPFKIYSEDNNTNNKDTIQKNSDIYNEKDKKKKKVFTVKIEDFHEIIKKISQI